MGLTQHVCVLPALCVCVPQVVFRAGAYLDLAANDGAALLAASDSAYDLSGLSVQVTGGGGGGGTGALGRQAGVGGGVCRRGPQAVTPLRAAMVCLAGRVR